ncbi:hypothetical protein DYD21_02865 [Rhodohalobacter sp. SW132]|nr:hypothetical protein DYD21_02865 [Rhodohalobacter sp. SW132]
MIALFVIILLIGGARMALKSDWLLDYARDLIVEQANQQINGELEIGTIRGDLLFGLTITDIRISDLNSDEILSADTLRVRYTLPRVIRTPHRLDLLSLNGVQANLVQDEDSVWNAEKLIPATEEDPEESDPVYWSIDRIILDHTNVSVRSDILLPDGFLEVEDLALQTMVEMYPDRWLVSLDELSLTLREGRLPSPIELNMQAVARDEQITLESLVVNTGRSLLRARASYDDGERITGEAELAPIARNDIEAYLEEYPLKKDLQIGLTAEGSLTDLNISVTADAGTGGNFSLSAGTDLSDPYILHSLDLEVNQFNGVELLGDTTLPTIEYLTFSGSGMINPAEPERANWSGDLLVDTFSLDEYFLDRAEFSYSVENESASLTGSLTKQNEEIELNASASALFSDAPQWRANLSTAELNLATWLQNPDLDSQLTINLEADGSGIEPEALRSNVDLLVSDGRFGDQEFSSVQFTGHINPMEVTGDLLALIDESRFFANFTIDDWADAPNYIFELGMESVNLAELNGLEELPTYLNGTLQGEGRSFDLETLQMSAVARLDSSIVNGEPIDTLRADLTIENQALFVENAILESPIADFDFSLRQHITDFNHPQNQLQFTAIIKDLFPIAPLFGLDNLAAEGRIEGELERNAEDILEFRSTLELENIVVDTLFTAERITGGATVRLLDEIEAESNVQISQPEVAGQMVQDFNITASATLAEDETFGNLGFELINDEESRLVHSGRYSITPERTLLTTTQIEFETPANTLSLLRPFDITFADDILSVDTLRIQSPDASTYIEFWAPHVDSLSQNLGLDASELNLGVLQRTTIGEEFVDGYLSGKIQVNNSPDSLNLQASGLLEQLQFEDGEMDSLQFSVDLANEWLGLELNASHDGSELFSGSTRVPFLPGDPATFDDQFFDREIEGDFVLNNTDINYWLSFVPGSVAEETEGTLSFNGRLGGQAGRPEFSGELEFRDGRLSGVPIDAVDIGIQYEHDEQEASFDGNIISRGDEILSFDSRVPFKIDLRELELQLPSDDDDIHVDIQTNDFNLAIFNDFVDRDVIRQIAGRVNGSLNISGTFANLEPSGQFQLTRGSMRIVPAGITIESIGSRISFRSNQLELHEFSMQSGPGRIRASGTVEIDNLVPGELDIRIRGNQFRAINTPEYNAIIDLTSNITGTFEEPSLRGSLTFLSGYVNLQNFGERAVEDVALEGEDEVEPMAFYDSMEIEMDVNFRRQFFIRNRQFLDLEIELGGQVDLLKRPQDDLEMFGQLEGVRGYARPLGRNFEIDEAFVTFSGPVENPELNVRTQYIPPQARTDVVIYYIIEGTAQDPEFRFESEPQMELQDIFSYTVFGRPFYELESWEQVVAGSGGGPSAADVALDVLLDRVELLASQRLGIDVVQIDNSRTGSNSTTSILTGWYLNRRTFFALINEVSTTPKTLFLLEYLLTENLELIITQGDDSREGVDLRWKYDY